MRSSASDRAGFILWIELVVDTTVASESDLLLLLFLAFMDRLGGDALVGVEVAEEEVEEGEEVEEASLEDPEFSSSL